MDRRCTPRALECVGFVSHTVDMAQAERITTEGMRLLFLLVPVGVWHRYYGTGRHSPAQLQAQTLWHSGTGPYKGPGPVPVCGAGSGPAAFEVDNDLLFDGDPLGAE